MGQTVLSANLVNRKQVSGDIARVSMPDLLLWPSKCLVVELEALLEIFASVFMGSGRDWSSKVERCLLACVWKGPVPGLIQRRRHTWWYSPIANVQVGQKVYHLLVQRLALIHILLTILDTSSLHTRFKYTSWLFFCESCVSGNHMLCFNEGRRFLDLFWSHERLGQDQGSAGVEMLLVPHFWVAERWCFADILLPCLLMLFKDLVGLPNVPLLALFAVFILEVAIVELRQAIENKRFVEVAHHLGIDLDGVLHRYLRILLLNLKHLDFNLYTILFQNVFYNFIIDYLVVLRFADRLRPFVNVFFFLSFYSLEHLS